MFKSLYTSTTSPVFLSVLCDNLLLTVVELLRFHGVKESSVSSGVNQINSSNTTELLSSAVPTQSSSCIKEIFHLHLIEENAQLGILYSTKAFVQLVTNPLVGNLTTKIGYKVPLCLGNFILMLCSLVFGFADSYLLYTVGRSFHGLASSLISISGMAQVAECYQDDEKHRTKFLGRVMGAAALGVLIGYPFGGVAFAIFGKEMPFICIAILATFNVVIQLVKIGIEHKTTLTEQSSSVGDTEMTPIAQLAPQKEIIIPCIVSSSLWTLLRDRSILVIIIAVWLTTSAMSILEPTLPIWLIETMDPPKWQLGLVFVPDSLGYFIGTNYFGQIALKWGRWKMSMISMAAIGIACFALPMAKHIWQLTLPHFTLGLGLGIVDASLMPLLACLADESHHAGYGVVYALAQTSVALAYSLGPLIGGELAPIIGFSDLIRTVGLMNLLFCPLISLLANADSHSGFNSRPLQDLGQYFSCSRSFQASSQTQVIQPIENQYQRFRDELDSD